MYTEFKNSKMQGKLTFSFYISAFQFPCADTELITDFKNVLSEIPYVFVGIVSTVLEYVILPYMTMYVEDLSIPLYKKTLHSL